MKHISVGDVIAVEGVIHNRSALNTRKDGGLFGNDGDNTDRVNGLHKSGKSNNL